MTIEDFKIGSVFWGPYSYLQSDGEWSAYTVERIELFYVDLICDTCMVFKSPLNKKVELIVEFTNIELFNKCEPFIGELPKGV